MRYYVRHKEDRIEVFDDQTNVTWLSDKGVTGIFNFRFYRKYILCSYNGQVHAFDFLKNKFLTKFDNISFFTDNYIEHVIEYNKNEILLKLVGFNGVWNFKTGQFLFSLPQFTSFKIIDHLYFVHMNGCFISFNYLENGKLIKCVDLKNTQGGKWQYLNDHEFVFTEKNTHQRFLLNSVYILYHKHYRKLLTKMLKTNNVHNFCIVDMIMEKLAEPVPFL